MKQEQAKGIALVATSVFAKSDKSTKDCLDEGSSVQVDLILTGRIGGSAHVSLPITGELSVGVGDPVGTSLNPKPEFLVAYLISQIPATRHGELLAYLRSHTKKGALQKPSDRHLLATAQDLIEALRVKKPKAGSKKFVAKSKP